LVVDPVEFKREQAPTFGATETFASIDEASERIAHLTNGQGVDVAVVAVGRVDGNILGAAFDKVGKAGVCVLLSVGSSDKHIAVSPQDFTNLAKSLRGVMYGQCNPTVDIPRLLEMYRAGSLKLDELVTRRYSLDQINQGYEDMHRGRNIRGVLIHDH
jgi:S-(hydroxymethyl)glutathione dehydrogenase/alcohol dehydrogenase